MGVTFRNVRQRIIFLPFVIVFSLLVSCQTDSKSDQTIRASVPATTPPTLGVDQPNALLKEFRPLIQGIWVSKRYERDLERTHSAEKSWDALMGTPEIFLDFSKLQHDSLKVFSSANNHEGDEFWLLSKRGLTPASLIVSRGEYDEETGKGNHWELAYRVNYRDTTLFFRCVTPNGKIKEETAYYRFFRSFQQDNQTSAITSLARQKLYAGTYRVLLPLNYPGVITFESNGRLIGVKGNSYYEPQTDFMMPVGGEALYFAPSENSKINYNFFAKWSVDTLLLYNAILEAGHDSIPSMYVIDTLSYRLLRQR